MNESINKKQEPFPKRFATEYPTWNANKSPPVSFSTTWEKCAPPSDSTQHKFVNLITEGRAHEKDNKIFSGPQKSDMSRNSTTALILLYQTRSKTANSIAKIENTLATQICIVQNRRISKSLPIRSKQFKRHVEK